MGSRATPGLRIAQHGLLDRRIALRDDARLHAEAEERKDCMESAQKIYGRTCRLALAGGSVHAPALVTLLCLLLLPRCGCAPKVLL